MKNKNIWLLLALMGLAGCKNNSSVDRGNSAPVAKQDTALVLGKYYFSDIHFLLLADKKGNTKIVNSCYENYKNDVLKFANVGDTLIAALNEKEPYVIRNLTIENKAKAFSKQK